MSAPDPKWADQEKFLLDQLKSGPKDTDQLRRAFEIAGLNPKHVSKMMGRGWMNLPRRAGAVKFAPHTVYHPDDPRCPPPPAGETWGKSPKPAPATAPFPPGLLRWVEDYMEGLDADPVNVAFLAAAAADGFLVFDAGRAAKSLGLKTYRQEDGGNWYRQRHA